MGTDTAFQTFFDQPRLDQMGNQSQEIRMATVSDRDPIHHTQKMRQRLEETMAHLREDICKVDEPQFKAMFETSAEVLGGLVRKKEREGLAR